MISEALRSNNYVLRILVLHGSGALVLMIQKLMRFNLKEDTQPPVPHQYFDLMYRMSMERLSLYCLDISVS